MKATLCLVFFFVLGTQGKTYYFNLNKTSNEYVIRNRVNLNGSDYVTRPQVGELRNNVTLKRNSGVINNHPLLDTEWDYNWKNVTREKLPSYINAYYNNFSENITDSVRFLFNSARNASVLHFSFQDVRFRGNVSNIELHFHQKVEQNDRKYPMILRLYELEADYNESALINPDSHKLLNVIYISQAETGWQLTRALARWIKNKTNIALFITMSKSNEDQFRFFVDNNEESFRTFLLIKSDNGYNLTVVDAGFSNFPDFLVENPPALGGNSCKQRDLHVNFEKLDWMKFIIAPSSYNAYNCYGTCYLNGNLPNHLKITNYLPEIARKPLCCGPVRYEPLSIIFYDRNGNVAIKNYRDMIISACGCT